MSLIASFDRVVLQYQLLIIFRADVSRFCELKRDDFIEDKKNIEDFGEFKIVQNPQGSRE